MNRLVDRTIEEFLRMTYGDDLVRVLADELALQEGLPRDDLQGCGRQALALVAAQMVKSRAEMFEDVGAWLTRLEPIRRLLRFSGRDFRDFLLGLEELPGRAHLVLPHLAVPDLTITRLTGAIVITVRADDPDWQPVLIGLVRGMADDYGALCLIDADGPDIRVEIWEERFAEGRNFRLSAELSTQGGRA